MEDENFTWEVSEDPEDPNWEGEKPFVPRANMPKQITRREFLKTLRDVGLGASVGYLFGKDSSNSPENKKGLDEVFKERKQSQSSEPDPVTSVVELDLAAVNEEQTLLAGTTKSKVFSNKAILVSKSDDPNSPEKWKAQVIVRGSDNKTGEDMMGVVFDPDHYPNKKLSVIDMRISPDGKRVFWMP